jgi:hypothetical protein
MQAQVWCQNKIRKKQFFMDLQNRNVLVSPESFSAGSNPKSLWSGEQRKNPPDIPEDNRKNLPHATVIGGPVTKKALLQKKTAWVDLRQSA